MKTDILGLRAQMSRFGEGGGETAHVTQILSAENPKRSPGLSLWVIERST